jgi:hypothetical protein
MSEAKIRQLLGEDYLEKNKRPVTTAQGYLIGSPRPEHERIVPVRQSPKTAEYKFFGGTKSKKLSRKSHKSKKSLCKLRKSRKSKKAKSKARKSNAKKSRKLRKSKKSLRRMRK